MDNDLFVGSDDGYTNGLYYAWYDVAFEQDSALQPGLLAKAMQWSLPDKATNASINAYTIGQAMVTPEDISLTTPDPNDLPYSGLLMLTNSYLQINNHYADRISTSLGIVGPASGAETSQTLVHDLLDSDEPMGWDAQLKNELVFQFTRGRLWRSWASDSDRYDILTGAELSLGTVESAFSGGAFFRTGSGLSRSYPSASFILSRTTNPVAIDGGWLAYIGFGVRYIANQIFVDGNTFRDSPSADLDHSQFGAGAGFSYSWGRCAITLAWEDLGLLEDQLEGTSRFGTVTFIWRK